MKSPLQVTGIDHVVFHVKDLARAKKFYVDFLGMEVDYERSWQCFLKCGNQGLALSEAKDRAEIHGGSEVNHMALQLMSPDHQPAKSTLENAGIEVHARDCHPQCLNFHDPDGHQPQLMI